MSKATTHSKSDYLRRFLPGAGNDGCFYSIQASTVGEFVANAFCLIKA